MKKLFALAAILMIVAVSGCVEASEEQIKCGAAGGEWKEFPNTCVDSCDYRRAEQETMCGMAMTYGCECGPDMCWNGESCELAEIEEETEEPELDIVYIDILHGEFDPAEVTVELGQTIVWTNKDDRTHAVGGSHFGGSSGTLQPGETWSYTVDKIQTYRFYDTFFYFKGTITVEGNVGDSCDEVCKSLGYVSGECRTGPWDATESQCLENEINIGSSMQNRTIIDDCPYYPPESGPPVGAGYECCCLIE